MTARRQVSTRGGIGASVLRHEDPPLLTGKARYIADIHLDRQLTMSVVRSPVAHGTLYGMETSEARSLPGVEAVFTAEDMMDDLGHVPRIPPRVSFDETVLPYLQPILARDRVRYTGEPLAVVVAEDRYVAEDAAELVFADKDQRPAMLDRGDRPGAGEQLFEAGNLITTLTGEFGEVDRIFRDAEVVVETELTIGRHSGVPMETRGLVVEFDPRTERLIVHGATKVPHWNLRTTAELLGISPSRLRMRETAIGGGFGVRGELYPGRRPGGMGCRTRATFRVVDRGPPRAPPGGQPLTRTASQSQDRRRSQRQDHGYRLGVPGGSRRLRPHTQHPGGRPDAVDDPRSVRPGRLPGNRPLRGHQQDTDRHLPGAGTVRVELRQGAHGGPVRSRDRHGPGGGTQAET